MKALKSKLAKELENAGIRLLDKVIKYKDKTYILIKVKRK